MRSVSDLGETPVEGKGEWELEQVGRVVQTRRRRGKEGGLGRTSLGDRAALREFGQHGRSSTQSRDRLSESLAWTGMAGPLPGPVRGSQPHHASCRLAPGRRAARAPVAAGILLPQRPRT